MSFVTSGGTVLIVLLLVAGLLCLVSLLATRQEPQPIVVISPNRSPESTETVTAIDYDKTKEITCMVVIPEFVFDTQADAPAVETAVVRELLLANFSVVDQAMIEKIRYRDETLLAAHRGSEEALTALRALAHEYMADVVIIGTAFTEGEFSAPEGLIATRAWAEVRAIDQRTGRIFAAEQTSAGGADLTINIAAKKALQNVGVVLGKAVTQALEKRFGKQKGMQDRVELILIGMPIDAYVAFKRQVQLFPQVKQIIADHYTVDEAHITIHYGQADLIDLVDFLRRLEVAGGRVEVMTYSLSRVCMRYLRYG